MNAHSREENREEDSCAPAKQRCSEKLELQCEMNGVGETVVEGGIDVVGSIQASCLEFAYCAVGSWQWYSNTINAVL